jgi:hypothetical protein
MSETANSFRQLGEGVENVRSTAKETKSTIDNLTEAVRALGGGLRTGTSGLDDLIKAGRASSEALTSTGGAIGDVIAKLPGMGGLGDVFKESSFVIGGVAKLLSVDLLDSAKATANLFDEFSKAIRETDIEMLSLTKSFGQGLDVAMEMSNSLPEQALTDFGRAAGLSIKEMKEFISQAKGLNINLDDLTENISTAYGNLNLYAVAAIQASAAGISLSESSRLLETAIAKQGMSAQSAVETIAGFSEVAKETGLSFSTVANTLNYAVSQFDKLGMSADFGRPILENFARTVKEVGLGIDVATESTRSLVSAMGGLSDNYGLAYLTQIKGGGGASAGGVLGTSIEMRQKMREAEATGEEGSIAVEMAKQIRDTISSMTGGNIITLEQAAKSPDLQSQYYMQGQMLSQYGIRDTGTQDAVLDLLSKIDEAKAVGDTQGQEELARQLSMEVEVREETRDVVEKVNIEMASFQANLQIANREFAELTRSAADTAASFATKDLDGIFAKLDAATKEGTELLKENMSSFTSGIEEIIDFFKDINKSSDYSDSGGDDNEKSTSMATSIASAIRDVFKDGIPVKIEASDDLKSLLKVNSPAQTMNIP